MNVNAEIKKIIVERISKPKYIKYILYGTIICSPLIFNDNFEHIKNECKSIITNKSVNFCKENHQTFVKLAFEPFKIAKCQEINFENLEKLKYELESKYSKEKEELKKNITELRKQILLNRIREDRKESKLKKSLIELYSEVLDELEGFNMEYSKKDELPRIVVVGEQSAGKTSVLEMVAGARLFPRGSGTMMTRSPVKVTLAEGPYRRAKFENDPTGKEYDLESEKGCAELRQEIETRMDNLSRGTTVSRTPVALSVKGPGLKRMVLVDLPGIINTVTTGMHSGAKDAVAQLATQYMSNPNAIILCIQDGSKDAESSSIVDLVSKMDPTGKRTIFVMTKVDLALEQMSNPNRINDILSGKVFRMRALGYYAVIAGRGNKDESIDEVRRYENDFFNNTQLFNDTMLKRSQLTTENLSSAVSDRFWKMVEDSVEKQYNEFKALRFNLETEWKHKFKGFREQDRMELFEKARNEILDSLLVFNDLGSEKWEELINTLLWKKVEDYVFEEIVIPSNQLSESPGNYQATVDILLKNWVDTSLPQETVEIGLGLFMEKLTNQSLGSNGNSCNENNLNAHIIECDKKLFQPLRDAVFNTTFQRFTWDIKAQRSLKVIQGEALNNATIKNQDEWNQASDLFMKSVESQLSKINKTMDSLKGPGYWTSYLKWTSKSDIQKLRTATIEELQNIFYNDSKHLEILAPDEITSIRRNLQLKKIDVNADFIQETWKVVYRQHLYKTMLRNLNDCKKSGYHFYKNDLMHKSLYDCHDVIFSWRLIKMLNASASALMMQMSNNENRRLELVLRDVLDDILIDDLKLSELLSGDRVKLAEDLKQIRRIQDKLGQFISSLKANYR